MAVGDWRLAIGESLSDGCEARLDAQVHCERACHKVNMKGCFSRGCAPAAQSLLYWLEAGRRSSTDAERDEW